jgi:glycosyltransferase involved in cell wall biosynthesis
MKRIAFISTNDHVAWGGSEVLWTNAAVVLKQRGIDVAVSVAKWRPTPHHINELKGNGIKIFYHYKNNSLIYSAANRVLQKILPQARIVWRSDYSQILNDFNPDLVIVSQGSLSQGVEAINQCNMKNVRYATSTRLVSELQYIDDRTALLLIRLIRSSLVNFFPCQASIDLAETQLGFRIPRSMILPSTYRFPMSDEYCDTLSYDQGIDLACVGALNTVHKGQDKLLKLFSMKKWRGRKINLHLYGSGDNENIIRRLIQEYGLSNVFMHGHVSNLHTIWNQCHGLIMASNMEGLPIALIEAMLFKKVSIVPDIGGFSDIIKDEINGFLAESSNVTHLDAALERAWDRRHEWPSIGMNAFLWASKKLPASPEVSFADTLLSLA